MLDAASPMPYVAFSNTRFLNLLFTLFDVGVMKAPPSQSDDHIISNSSVDNATDSDDGLNDAPHSPSREGDFSEYLWMENEEEFEQQIMQQLEEEALMQQCIEAMQDEMNSVGPMPGGIFSNGNNHFDDPLTCGIQNLTVDEQAASQVITRCYFIHYFY